MFQRNVGAFQLRDEVLLLALDGLDLRSCILLSLGQALGQEIDLLLQEAPVLLHLGALLKGFALQTLDLLLTFLQLRLHLLHIALLTGF